nr:RnfABCDGE type electron transport complex subunit D [uncultured Blautia sp.]
MEQMLNVSSNPHVRDKMTTSRIMQLVALALLPTTLFGIWNFGFRALLVVLVTVVSSVFFEWLYDRLMHKKNTINDFSAVVTGLLLALNMPPQIPLWMPVLGSAFAIIVVKQLFGGLGQNFMNPALAARCFLMISFAGKMTDFAVDKLSGYHCIDTVTGATALAELKNSGFTADSISVKNLFIGNIHGTIGETSAIAILIGAVILLAFKVIDLKIPLTYIGSFAVFVILYMLGTGKGFDVNYLFSHLFGGGLMLGAWFMATDYVTTPITPNGQLLYGCCLGVVTAIFRLFGGSAEGVSYAIIFCNLLVPLIEKVTKPVAFGKGGKKA